jgi:hypothetical protein
VKAFVAPCNHSVLPFSCVFLEDSTGREVLTRGIDRVEGEHGASDNGPAVLWDSTSDCGSADCDSGADA